MKQPISKLKYTIEKGCREVAFFSYIKVDGVQSRPEYEEPRSLVCRTTYENEEASPAIAISKPFMYICLFVKSFQQ